MCDIVQRQNPGILAQEFSGLNSSFHGLLECEVHVDGIRLEHVSEFKYLGCVSGTDGTECSRKVMSGKRVAGAIRSLVNAREM